MRKIFGVGVFFAAQPWLETGERGKPSGEDRSDAAVPRLAAKVRYRLIPSDVQIAYTEDLRLNRSRVLWWL